MTSELDRDLALTSLGADRFSAELGAGWGIGSGLNGGYLLAVLGTAVRESVPGKPDPLAVSAHYLGPCVPGPAEVTTRVVREGGSVATVVAELSQQGLPRIIALATYGDLTLLPDDVRTTARPPDLPPVEQCFSSALAPSEVRQVAPIMERFDMRFDPAGVGWAMGEPSGEGRLRAWFRLADGRDPDPISLLLAVDALPPVTFDLGMPGWAPTIELTAHIRAVPAPGWLQVQHRARNVAGGMFEEDCEVWDSAGRLVAQSRQLARLPR